MKSAHSWLGTILVAAAIVVSSWLALRSMTDKQRSARGPTADASSRAMPAVSSGVTLVPPIPAAIVADAGKTPLARLDVTLRVDGLDLALDGAQACRDGSKRMVGRDPSGALGSFDEKALLTCVTLVRAARPEARVVAMIGRAGPAVPSTFVDALIAALKRGGVEDVVVGP